MTPSAGASGAGPVSVPDAGAAGPCAEGAVPRAGKSIGHTSTVFKLELADGRKVAWKPNARKVKGRWRGEVAAYRLAAGALGLANVPVACARRFDHGAIVAALAANPDAARVFADEAIVEGGVVDGVVIPWIEGLRFWPIEREPLRSEVRGWLTAGRPVPEEKLALARQVSTLVGFDRLTGNWDRYSGENVGLDASGLTVLFIDNDAGFMELPPKDRIAHLRSLVEGTDRWSRSFVERLRTLDEARLTAVLGQAPGGDPLLSAAAVARIAVEARALLASIDEKISRRSASDTLFFP